MLCAVKIGSWRWSIGLQSQPMTTRFLVRFLRPPIFFGEPAVLKYVHCQHTPKKIVRQISNPSNAGSTGLNWPCLGTKKMLPCRPFMLQLIFRTTINSDKRVPPKNSEKFFCGVSVRLKFEKFWQLLKSSVVFFFTSRWSKTFEKAIWSTSKTNLIAFFVF